MKLVDFHCHLDLYPDHAALIDECERAGVFTLAVTTTPKAWPRNYDMTASTRHVRAALGLHPQLVSDRAAELVLWEELLPRTRYVGEVGLDAGPRFYKSLDKQKEIFERVLVASAAAHNKILTVHSVRTVKTVLDMIEKHMPPTRGRVVLHWFTGTSAEAKRAVDLGCYFSVNAAMLSSERAFPVVARLPIDRILTETDGPFTQTGSRPSRPVDVSSTAASLANAFSMEAASMIARLEMNLRALLQRLD